MEDSALVWYSAIVWVLNGAIFLTIITFLCKFSQNKGKEIGLYMTLIPNFSYLAYSCFDILSEGPSFRDKGFLIQAIKTSIAHFSMYWSASFGLFTRLNAVAARSPHFMPQYMVTSLILCLVIAVSSSAIYLHRPHIDKVFLFSAGLNVLLPFLFSLITLITAYIQRNRGNCHVALASIRSINHLRIFWYSLVPIVCLGVDLLVDIYRQSYHPSNSQLIAIITSLIYRTWAITSLVKYWLVTKAHRDRVASVGSLDLSLIHETMGKRSGSLLHTSTSEIEPENKA